MKRWVGFALHLVMMTLLTSFGTYALLREEKQYTVPQASVVNTPMKPTVLRYPIAIPDRTSIRPPFLGKAYHGFKEALAFKESQGKYTAINTFGYLGKYQFGIATLRLIGIYNAYHFMKNPALQEKAFEANIARNKWILRRYIKHFKGIQIRGMKITESGILAAAHLAGAGNVKKYLRSFGRYDVSDAYGSRISNYMKQFAGYDISTIRQKRNAKV